RLERLRGAPAGGQVGERSAQERIGARSEQQVEHPARRAVLTDLLREGVLVEVDEDEDAALAAELHHRRDAVEVGAIVLPAGGLEGAPADRQPQQVEAE